MFCRKTAVYLAISFTRNNWDRSWIIWPVAGVLFGGLVVIANKVIKD